MSRGFRFDTPAAAVAALLQELSPVAIEEIAWDQAPGRVLAQPLLADRESPPCDVSAMDGYAVRLQDLKLPTVPVAGQIQIGQPTPILPAGKAMKIVTGAPVPAQAQAIVPREQTAEEPERFTLTIDQGSISPGQYIRRRGENLSAGAQVVPAGSLITPAVMAALATFGVLRPKVYRQLRVGILTTGDELLPIEGSPQPWQIRDSNGPALQTLISLCPRLQLTARHHVADDEQALERECLSLLDQCDVLLLTGGVSMGDYDYVPAVVGRIGARTIFHRLPIRPGRPLLAAEGPRGQFILGLPGNPLSVMVCACRLGRPALGRLAGLIEAPAPPSVMLSNPDDKRISLWWYRPVALAADGSAQLVPSRGSGDIVSAARSDGFIEVPPQGGGTGPWPFYRWEL